MPKKVIFNPTTGKLDFVSEEDLSGCVPYTGATANVDLGNNALIVDKDGSTGLMKHTTTTGAISYITDNSSNWNTAYTHSQDNTQAHSDYLLNSGNDSTSGILTTAGLVASGATDAYVDITTGSGTYDGAIRFYDVSTGKYYIGWDDSDTNDDLIIGAGVAVGSNALIRLRSSAIVLAQPAYCGSTLNITGETTSNGIVDSSYITINGLVSVGKSIGLEQGTTTPPVNKTTYYFTENSSAQDVEKPVAVLDGQLLIIRGADTGNTTMIHGNGMVLKGAANRTLADGDTIQLLWDETVDTWCEI